MKWLALWCGALSAIAFLAHGLDKRSAARGTCRVRERTLHLLAAAGGWPGALLGMRVFRHKTRKLSFRLVTAAIVLLELGAAAFAWRGGFLP
jgi:uncharacterized membrane protein YsdA (DUF1294 family)